MVLSLAKKSKYCQFVYFTLLMDQRLQPPDKTAGQILGRVGRAALPTRTLAWIGAFALITGLAYFLYFGPTYQPDSPTYIVPAQNLLSGHGFTGRDASPETARTPGYPLFLLPFLRARLDLKYMVIFQHLLRVILIVATSAFTFFLTGSSRQTVIVGVLLCIDFPLLASANSILTEMLFTVVLCVALWLLCVAQMQPERAWINSLVAGLVSGASVLVRPISLLIFIPAAAYLLLAGRSHRWRTTISFVLAFSVLPVSWAARNYIRCGYFTVSTISGYNLLAYRAAGVLAIEDPGKFSDNLEIRTKELKTRACEDLSRLHSQDCSQLPISVVSDYYSRLGRKILLNHPLACVKLSARGAAAMMLGGDADSMMKITRLAPGPTKALILIYTLPALCFAIAGLGRLWKENKGFFHLAFLIILYFVVISAGGEAYSRFRVPIIPLYVILAASGVDSAWLLLSHRVSIGRLSRDCHS